MNSTREPKKVKYSFEVEGYPACPVCDEPAYYSDECCCCGQPFDSEDGE